MKKRVHLHIKYVERSEGMYITQDLMKYAAQRLGIAKDEDEDEDGDLKRGETQFYITTPEFKKETKLSNKRE